MTVLRRTVRDTGMVIVLAGLVCAVSVWGAYELIYDGLLERARVSVALDARGMASALALGHGPSDVVERAGTSGYDHAFVVDRSQRVLASWPAGSLTDAQVLALPAAAKAYAPGLDGSAYTIGSAANERGHRLILMRAARANVPLAGLAVVGGVVWLLVSLATVTVAWRARREDPSIRELARGLARGHIGINERRDFAARHGSGVNVLFDLAEELEATRAELSSTREVGQAAFQMGPHYMLLCDFEGRVLDANPAFLARSGLSVEDLSKRSADILEELLPVEDLTEYGRRSLQEGVTLSGIPCRAGFQGEVRTLEGSVRALSLPSGPAMVLVLADHQRRDELEKQIDQFMDSVDLMVDQRVARIAEHHASFETLLSDIGIAIYEFSSDGSTRRVNTAAERLIGRTQFTLRSIDDVVRAIVADSGRRESFRSWLTSSGRTSFVARATTPEGDRWLVWVSGEEKRVEGHVRRILLGAPLPEDHLPTSLDDAAAILQGLDVIAAALDPASFPETTRSYVEVLRNAVRRLDPGATNSGDGAVVAPADHVA